MHNIIILYFLSILYELGSRAIAQFSIHTAIHLELEKSHDAQGDVIIHSFRANQKSKLLIYLNFGENDF